MLMEQVAAKSPLWSDLSVPLWGLVIFIVWIILVVAMLLTVRIRHLATGGSVQDFAIPNNDSLLWRLYRVHANLTENLPLYLGVVFLLTLRGVAGTVVDALIIVYIGFRVLHSLIHIAGLNPILRVICLGIQFSCLVTLTVLAVSFHPAG